MHKISAIHTACPPVLKQGKYFPIYVWCDHTFCNWLRGKAGSA